MRSQIYLGPTAPNPSRDALTRQMNAFLQSGGKIHRVKGFSGVAPLPKRKVLKPAPKPKRREPRPPEWHAERLEPYADEVVKHFLTGITATEAGRRVGIGSSKAIACLEHRGIDKDLHRKRRDAAEPELAEKVRAMAADRYTIRYTAQILDQPPNRITVIARKYGIKFSRSP